VIVEELEPLTPDQADDLARWNALGRRLRELDPARFRRALALAWTYVAIYENPDESEEAFAARLELISPSGMGGN
jgi:hypothetical protein